MGKGSGEVNAFLGKGTEFQGQLKFEGTIRIDGLFRGEINTNGTLIVGESGRVEAEIKTGTLITSGEVVGNIMARERIEALSPAKIMGNVQTPVLIINEGVIFEGNSKMVNLVEGAQQEKERKIPFLGKGKKKEAELEEVSEGDR